METDFSRYNETFVRVIVQNKTKPIIYDNFINSIQNAGAYEVSIIEDFSEQPSPTTIEDISKDTMSLINEEIDKLEDIDNKLKLKRMIHELYLESLTSEE
jgi:hypothetical protein